VPPACAKRLSRILNKIEDLAADGVASVSNWWWWLYQAVLATAMRRKGRWQADLAREAMSRRLLGEQFGQADEILGGHRQGELPIDLGQSAMPRFAQASSPILAHPKASSPSLRIRWKTA
jgi:hypothetical protein